MTPGRTFSLGLAAALDEIVENRSTSITMSAVARRSGVSLRSLYYEFHNRDELVTRCRATVAASIEGAIEVSDLTEVEPILAVITLTDRLFDAYRTVDPALLAILADAGAAGNEFSNTASNAWNRVLGPIAEAGHLALPLTAAIPLTLAWTGPAAWLNLAGGSGSRPNAWGSHVSAALACALLKI